ncbi:OPT/YSL family transporter, partial [Collinsella vaginalis]|uniref:OPT/YSL family transporter n=1 Tax=Collinsella vaginalis TaxID=1870987 RepID=UPI00117E60B9
VWALLRDAVGALPAMLAALPIPGVAFGVFNSPMMLSVGFLMGTTAIAAQLIGGVLANFGIIVGGTAAGLFDLDAATGIVKSLGMGLMMGSGLGVVVKDVLPHARAWFAPSGDGAATDIETRTDAGALALMAALAALIVSVGLGLGPVVAVIMVLLSFVTTVMSAQSVGQTGIDPMEIFGLIVLLIVAAVTDTQTVGLFLVAGVVAVACGLAGDVMSDFKTGAIIGTNPRAMWAGQAIGALIGSVVAAVTLAALASAYGVDAFGPGKLFVSAQASVVATMVSGIPSVPAFAVGVAAGIVLYLVGLPAMMLGLGVYLPFYMTLSMAFGAVAKFIWDRMMRARGLSAQESGERGVVIASGLLGGESIVGVLIALVSVVMGMLG